MKKFLKALLVAACAGTLCAGALAFSACGKDSGDNGAYGLVHGAGYIGYSAVTVDKDDKVTDVTLTEVCFPTQVPKTPKTDTAAATYYSEVSYGKVTMTYDEDAKAYKVDGKALSEFFKDEENCKEYFNAVKKGKVYVTVDNGKKNNVMTWDALCKDKNGYWATANTKQKLNWKGNRDATVNYVKTYGIQSLLSVTKKVEGENAGYWFDKNDVNTGATWTDFNTRKDGTYSYAELIVKAYNKVAKTPISLPSAK